MCEVLCYNCSDGHGVLGHEVAKFLKDNLPGQLESEIRSKMNTSNFNINNTISEVYISLNLKLFNDPSIDSHFR